MAKKLSGHKKCTNDELSVAWNNLVDIQHIMSGTDKEIIKRRIEIENKLYDAVSWLEISCEVKDSDKNKWRK